MATWMFDSEGFVQSMKCADELIAANPQIVQKIEAGRLNILVTALVRLQTALRCSWDDLMDDSK